MSQVEYGFHAKDEDDIHLYVASNSGADKKKYLSNAKTMKRPVLIEIQGEIFHKYEFTNFALTIDEARELSRELNRMLDYLEE